jgi:hypothetical protein
MHSAPPDMDPGAPPQYATKVCLYTTQQPNRNRFGALDWRRSTSLSELVPAVVREILVALRAGCDLVSAVALQQNSPHLIIANHSATESQQIWRSGLAEEYKPIRARPCRCAGGLTIRVITEGRFRGAQSQPRRGRALRHTRSRSQHPKAPALHLTAYLTQPLGPGPARFRSVLEDSFGQNKYNQSKVNTISPKFLLTIGKKKRHRKVKSVRITALQSHHSESNQGHSDVCNPLQSDALPTELW